MTSENGTNMYMPVAPAYGGGMGGDGFWGGSGCWWIILLLICLGGWGNGWGGGFGGGNGGMFPWLMNGQQNGYSDVQRGFDQNAVMNGITGVQNAVTSGFGNVQTALCNGFAGVNAGIANGFAQAEIANNARQIADMQQSFANQTAMAQGFNTLGSQFANCCCENRLGLADVKYTVATENCADRTAAMQNTRDIIDNQTRGTQAILDKLCALELDGVKGQLAEAQRENVSLQNQLNMATMRESQTAQNAFIAQGLSNEVDALYNRLNSCPVPTTPVYGRTPIFTCNNNGYAGCCCGAA